jgi:hypothetical protein
MFLAALIASAALAAQLPHIYNASTPVYDLNT